MPGAGTDKSKDWADFAGPILILVEPQLGENIGAAARVMANFGLSQLRLVKPRDGWPNIHASRSTIQRKTPPKTAMTIQPTVIIATTMVREV